jgi:phenylpropionate dioxygenase-like ring-hydroxylating dioxygenase large terminal subunit
MSYLESIQRSIAEGRALDAECYRNPAWFELERERVLRPGWHAVARWDDLPEPGDYRALDLFGEPVVLVRDAERQLRVFSNVCRHRAHTVAQGGGNAKRLVCPYHRWAYELDGRLATTPLMDVERERCALPEVRTDRWQGFVFATLDPESDPISKQLGALDERLARFDLASMHTADVIEFDSPWNWKVLVDNFMESYHHLGPHVESLHATNPAGDTYSDETLQGPCSWLVNPGQKGAPDFYVVQVFPTLLMAVVDEVMSGTWYEMQIDRHDHFHLRIHLLGSAEFAQDTEARQGMREMLTGIHLEDIEVCDAVQRGIQSRLWQPGSLSEQESALARFQRYLAECLSGQER